jgi:hypothetical protein
MSVEIIELMLRDRITVSDVKKFFSHHLKIPSENILESSDYWGKVLDNQLDYLCLDVINSENGFQTLVSGYINTDVNSDFYEELAVRLVACFRSDVVVPDYREKFEGPDRIIIYFKDGKCAEGINVFLNGFNEVEITSHIDKNPHIQKPELMTQAKTVDLYSLDCAKRQLQEIIERVVIDYACKEKLIETLYMREKILPLKGIMNEMQSCNKLPYLKEEIETLNDLTAIYI